MLLYQSFVDQTVAVPALFFTTRLGQGYGLTHKTSKGIRLGQRLTIQLIYPLLRAVGRNDDQGTLLIVGLGNSWCHIEQRRTRGNADNNRFVKRLRHSQGIETRRAFVGDGIALDVRALVEVVYDG